MGTISEKLTYLNNTKQQIKENLNKFGSNITENDTFRSYSNVINDIYDKLPKVSANGSDFALENAQNGKLDSFGMDGNTEQTTYTGKNLFNTFISHQAGYTATNNGITFTINDDGTITANGTNTSNAVFEIAGSWNNTTKLIDLDSSKTYKLSEENNRVVYVRSITGTTLSTHNSTNETTSVISGKEGLSYLGVELTPGTYNNIIFKPQIEEGSTATSFEPYVGGTPSPNPDYPQNINVVSGNNNIVVCGKNLFDKDTMVMNSAIDAGSGNMTSSDNFRTAYIKCKPNTTYSISKILSNRFVVGFTSDEDLTLPKTLTNVWFNQSITTKTITSPNNAYYMLITLSKITDDTASIQDILDSLQVEINEAPTTYEAYTEATYPIGLGSMELCKIDTYKDSIKKSTGKNLFDKNNANILNSSFSNDGRMLTSSQNAKTLYIPCKPNTTYTVSKIASQRFRLLTTEVLPSNGVVGIDYDFNDNGTSITITTSANIEYLCVYYFLNGTDTLTEQQILDSIQIEENNQATDYEPFGTEWYIKKEIGKVVLDGSETLQLYATLDKVARYVVSKDLSNSIQTQVYTNYFMWYSSQNRNTEFNNTANDNEAIHIRDDLTAFGLKINKTIAPDVTTLRTWLSSHNVEVYYVLATPTYETITNSTLISQLESIETITGLNYFSVSNENNVLPTLYVSRLKELGKLE